MLRALKLLDLTKFQGSYIKKSKCSLCNKITKHTLIRGSHSASSTEVLKNEKKKRDWRKPPRFTDLLEVSVNKTNERKTKITRLKGNSLHKIQDEFIRSCDIEESSRLDILGDVNGIEDDQIIASLAEMDSDNRSEILTEIQSHVESDDQIHSSINTTSKININRKTNKTKNKELMARIKLEDLDKSIKENTLNLTLLSYVEACVACGFLNRGWYTVQYYIKKMKYSNTMITDIRIFHALFDACAKTGQVERLIDIWNCMTNVIKLIPNEESYAKRFETIGRSTEKDKLSLLHASLRIFNEQGLSLDDMFLNTEWKHDSKEVVLHSIRSICPNYKPKIVLPDTNYTCHLVNHLNEPPSGNVANPIETLFNVDDLKTLYKEQLELEKKTYVKVPSIYEPPEITDSIKFSREQLEKLESYWEKAIAASFSRNLALLCTVSKKIHNGLAPINVHPYLAVLDKSEYVDIIMHEIRKIALGPETYSPSRTYLCKQLGELVKMRYDIKIKSDTGVLKKTEAIYKEYLKWCVNPNEQDSGYNGRHQWQIISAKFHEGPSVDVESEPWPNNVLIEVGMFLYDIILKTLRINANLLKPHLPEIIVPAVYPIFRVASCSKSSIHEVKPHPVLCRLYRSAYIPFLVFPASELPMVSPPKPWCSVTFGGYLIAMAPIVRLAYSAFDQRTKLKEAPPSQLYPSFDSLNQLGSIPWKVNTVVLDIITKLFKSGGSSKLNIPLTPPPSEEHSTEETTGDTFKARMQKRKKASEMYSLWCDAHYRLSLANHFREKVFWLPHNMDFRGRVYPCPPHLSHLGSDLYRSLLVFAQKKPLGIKGLDWLKIHCINLSGVKKRNSIADRLSYANEILPQIIDSANDPLKDGSWWQGSDEPWQTLATCIEIRDALNHPDGPETYLSGFPVHQDGSCNGLQHYAALGRDEDGATSVNLSPSDIPQDVYLNVAAIVDRERAKDAAEGNEVANILEGFVQRKVVKQTVMTTVYGVTRFGGRLQIAKQLEDLEDFPKDFIWGASRYLVNKTFDSIREMFKSAREIQDWFTEAARVIASVRSESVEYVTPLGLPVVQPYSRGPISKKGYYKATLGNIPLVNKFDKFERPNIMKQKNAFPPNFIHSLDSTHMMLTSLHCQRAGISFVSVHDCFWTHPSSVEIMNKVCREQFVVLHSEPILQDLSNFLFNKYAFDEESMKDAPTPSVVQAMKDLNDTLKNYPERGHFDLKKVLDSVYFFS